MKEFLKYAIWTIRIVVVVGLAGFLHWSLPSRDIVRIVGTEVVRRGVLTTDAQGNEVERAIDVRHINAVFPSGAPSVYRNEDTDWGWPPYFKFDSANLAVEAENAISPEANPEWVIVTHYGWRATFFSMFPNAISIRPAEGPDQRLIPWFNMVVVVLVFGGLFLVRRRVRQLLGFGPKAEE